MNTAFYTGKSGIMAYSNGINVIAHNISNSGTYGYKTSKAEFRELVYNELDQNFNQNLPAEEKVLTGHGVKIQSDSLQFSQGVLATTNYLLDFAIASGNSLFAIENNGEVQYTRNGAFDISVEGENSYLVANDGSYVLDRGYNRIPVTYDEQGLPDTTEIKVRLGVFSFDNPYGLYRVDGQNFLPTTISGEARIAQDTEYDLQQGMLENANIDLAKEMTDLIVAQRSYQFATKVVQTADEIEDIVNNLRR